MFYLFTNLLAAKDGDTWIQVVVIAVIIGFSLLKAIARSIKAMAEKQKEQSQPLFAQRPATKKYVDNKGGYKTLEQLREERIAQIRAAFGIPQPPIEQEPAAAEAPQVVEKIEKPPAPSIPETQKVHTDKQKTHVPAAVSSRETVHKLLFSSSGDLRKAILYQEILGKPLALRDM
jgi:hypothetical protein